MLRGQVDNLSAGRRDYAHVLYRYVNGHEPREPGGGSFTGRLSGFPVILHYGLGCRDSVICRLCRFVSIDSGGIGGRGGLCCLVPCCVSL